MSVNKKEIPCLYFNSPSGCIRGTNCRYNHAIKSTDGILPLCRYYNSPTGCHYGNLCRYRHEESQFAHMTKDEYINRLQNKVQNSPYKQLYKHNYPTTQQQYNIHPPSYIPQQQPSTFNNEDDILQQALEASKKTFEYENKKRQTSINKENNINNEIESGLNKYENIAEIEKRNLEKALKASELDYKQKKNIIQKQNKNKIKHKQKQKIIKKNIETQTNKNNNDINNNECKFKSEDDDESETESVSISDDDDDDDDGYALLKNAKIKWVCNQCTFYNLDFDDKGNKIKICEICNGKRNFNERTLFD